ncbi:hypothetical protein SAMN05443529_12356 [Desulfosporosinus hippei DSM 8344]|uniref:PQQ-like domain-containing protein n=1 Tax=Desulfosporosinus hippei DSM 8344 TaxID=1121419 RepID=A0A1G8GTU2_9FIRM|nr:hypothetical protein SAMN05443529_12356 [Desulfosporosinus hippei DSM 8344]
MNNIEIILDCEGDDCLKRKIQLVLILGLLCALLWSSLGFSKPGLSTGKNDPENTDEGLPMAGLHLHNDFNNENNWLTISGISTNYVKLEDINPSMVPEIKMDLNIDSLGGLIVRETNNGLLCGYKVNLATSLVNENNSKSWPKILKLDLEGNVVWDKVYMYPTISGEINNLQVFPDGSYIFSVQTSPRYSDQGMICEKSILVKCDKNGEELWQREFDDDLGDMLRYLFITEKEEILAVGKWSGENGKQTRGGEFDIVVTKLAKDGQVIQQKGFGGSGFENLDGAKYDKDLGMIINGHTTSQNGDFGLPEGQKFADFVARIAVNLSLEWVVKTNENEHFVYNQLGLADGYIYVLGDKGCSVVEGTLVSGFLIKLDENGNRVWLKSDLHKGLWGCVLSLLPNNNIIIAAGQQNQGSILVVDYNGQEEKRMNDIKYAAGKIRPTSDGGYIVTAVREIKCIPQPAYVSSIWYDTELVVIKYKHDNTIEWRKTYDKYKDEKGLDFVFPLANGKVIVEG